MKRFLTLLSACLLLTACAPGFEENRESRSTVYQGQTTWDLYENFGAPSAATRISDHEFHFIYHREEVTRDWSHMFFDWCDMTFIVVDDHVTDWHYEGNQCHVNVGEPVPVTDSGNTRQSRTERHDTRNSSASKTPTPQKDGWETLF